MDVVAQGRKENPLFELLMNRVFHAMSLRWQLPLCGLPAAQWNHVGGRTFLYGYIGHC